MCEYQPLLDLEELWHQRMDADDPSMETASDLPPLDWVQEMIETLMMIVEYGDHDAAYECTEHAWDRAEMYQFVDSAPGTHPTWLAFKKWAKEVLAEE